MEGHLLVLAFTQLIFGLFKGGKFSEHVVTAKRKLERRQFLTYRLSKFEVNLKHIFQLFWLYNTCFWI